MLKHYDVEPEGIGETPKVVDEKIAGIIGVTEMSLFYNVPLYLVFTSSKVLGVKYDPSIGSNLAACILGPWLSSEVFLEDAEKASTTDLIQELMRWSEEEITDEIPKILCYHFRK